MTILTLEKLLLVLLLSILVCAVKYSVALSPSCEYISSERKLVCKEITDPPFTQDFPEYTDLIVITSNTLACDCALKTLVRWKETSPAHSRSLALQGFCSSPENLVGRSINDLSSEEIPCGAAFGERVLVRKRRAVVGGDNETEPAKNQTYTPGAPVFPCDFEEGFCQWFQLIDDEFHWRRQKGPTPSSFTGPNVDHTTGTVNGSYLYIETSLPRRPFHSARLASPTLAAVDPNSTCIMDIYIHMRGGDIGTINIYQAPVEGFAVKKFSLSNHQGSNWFKRQILFDSDKEFQVIIEGIRGKNYQGDIAIDDISFTAGCKRLAPSYVRLTGSSFDKGRVEIYHQGAWAPVCREGWSQEDSSVACRELGFNKSLPLGNAGSSLNKTFTVLYNVSCVGNETSIKNCPLGVWSNNTSCPSDSLAFVGCSGILPVCPLKTHFYCPADTNSNKKCISRAQLCDFTKDCWDGSDELNCDNYTRCDFNDTNLCGWLQAKNDQMDWIRHRDGTPSANTGPSTDPHGSPYSYYLYMEVSGRQGGEKARILTTPRFQGNNNGLCEVRFYFHMYGPGIGTLRVLAADRYSSRTLWSKSFSQSIDWTRAEVQLANMSSSFIVMFEGEHGGRHPYGDIAIDDVSFSPECRPSPHENVSCKAGTLHCGSGECIPLSLQCDFNDDCFDGTDELNCGLNTPGRCDFEADLCHWQNMTDDKFDWQRHSGNTPSVATGPMYDHTIGFGGLGHYLYIEASSPRVFGDKARLISPQFMWKNAVNCTLRFYYHMKGFLGYHTIGRLRVRLKNSITGDESSPLWERVGHQGDQWIRADVAINTSWPVTQVIFEAVRGLTYHGDISIDDISFSPECYPSEAVHIYKNYDVRLVDGVKGSFEGRVEVYRVGSWGTICDDGWGLSDANVVCKQLGYASAMKAHGKSYFGEGKGRIWLDDLACMGNETNIGECLHRGWGSHDCTHKQDAGVVCDKDGGSATKAIRLLRNNSTLSGQVEIYDSGSWEAICYDTWDIHDASVACRQLGYSGATGITSKTPAVSPGNGLNTLQCRGNENALGDCVLDWKLTSCSYGFAGVTCSAQGTAEGNIRLLGGSSENEGRVEVYHQGEWGTVCDDHWKEENAHVVCYELGFTSVRKALQSFGPGRGRVWMDQVNCNGNESAFVECPNSGWGNTACTHQEDVGVICSDEAYVGCYKDTINHVMIHELTAASMTPVKCIRRCQSKGYAYAGLEWANECYCGNHYDRYGNVTSCTLSCFGDASKICGGPWALSVYDTNPAIIPTGVPGHPAVTQSCTRRSRFLVFNFLRTLTDEYYGGDHRSGWISTPRFPFNYQDNTDCIWVLKLLPNTRVRITFQSFYTEPQYDFVEIRDGEKDYSQPYLTPVPRGFNGNLSGSVTASSNVMWIKFHSDTSVTRQGFNLTYEAVGAPTEIPPVTVSTSIPPSELPTVQFIEGGCNGITHTDNTSFGYFDWYHNTGFVQSPNYPSNYPNNQVCRWSIQVAPGFRILATVMQADLAHATQSGRLGDTLHLDDGISVKRSNEHSAPWEFLSNASLVRIIFITDSANTRKGFYIHYQRVNINEEGSSTTSLPITAPIASTALTGAVSLTSSAIRATNSKSIGVEVKQTLQSAVTVPTSSPVLLTTFSIRVQLTQTTTSPTALETSAIQVTSSSIGVSSTEEINTTPAVENTNAANKRDKEKDKGMGGGTVALIVIPIILVIIAVIFFLILYFKKKKRSNPGVRHFFINEAYDNLDSMAMGNTNRGSSEYAEPVTPNGTHASAQTALRQDPAAHLTVAPPPYSQRPSDDILLVSFPATAGDRMIPVGIDNATYAGLYAAPPAYEATVRTPANGTTTTGIGSVTSLREAARDDGITPPASTVQPAGLYSVPLSRTALPPIRGTHGTADQEKKQYPQEEEAGPLPDKQPLTLDTPVEPSAPPRPLSAASQVRVVPVSDPEPQFNTEVPFEFLCPITNKIMNDPVTAADGYNYERKAIRRWFRRKRTSPLTNEELSDLTVRANDALRNRIETFVRDHSEV